ncbi:hypothetical protein PoB_006331500 [Plakobranchus ocellatus]|uniref:Uncharacterized protein n=1 Tax=Plakobranchus ocellatus TaxID=259542 RepID=A0AAV4CYF1_9GAST|nr:hypothetical protein PoB_006331500 [Plakobranchus ocellatus]
MLALNNDVRPGALQVNLHFEGTRLPQLPASGGNSSSSRPARRVGDFNSYSRNLGYENIGTRDEEVEEWQVINHLQLLIDKDEESTFYSRVPKTTTPDLTFAKKIFSEKQTGNWPPASTNT